MTDRYVMGTGTVAAVAAVAAGCNMRELGHRAAE